MRQQLQELLAQLASINPTWQNWSEIQTWAVSARLVIRRYFPDDVELFDAIFSMPQWLHMPRSLESSMGAAAFNYGNQQREIAANNELAKKAHRNLLEFVDRLIKLMPDKTEPKMQIREYDILITGHIPEIVARTESAVHQWNPQMFVLNFAYVLSPERWFTRAQLDSAIHEAGFTEPIGPEAFEIIKKKHLQVGETQHGQVFRLSGKARDEFSLRLYPSVASPTAPNAKAGENRPTADPKRVFVIYGRNQRAYDAMVKFLRALKLDPKGFNELSSECGPNPTVLAVVRHGLAVAKGVVAVFTPDEWAVLRPAFDPQRNTGEESRRWQARPNVIFEAGLALGMAAERTILVKLGRDVKLFSDVGGIHTVNLDNGHESRILLRDKLRAAGCEPDMKTGDHLHVEQAGDFERCVQFPDDGEPVDPFRPTNQQRKPARRKK